MDLSKGGFILFLSVFVVGILILFSGLAENNDYSLEGIEETVLTVQAIPTTRALELDECFDLCDFAFEKFSEDNLTCVAQCKE